MAIRAKWEGKKVFSVHCMDSKHIPLPVVSDFSQPVLVHKGEALVRTSKNGMNV